MAEKTLPQLTVLEQDEKSVLVQLSEGLLKIRHSNGKITEGKEIRIGRKDFYRVCPYVLESKQIGVGGEYAYSPKFLREVINEYYKAKHTDTSVMNGIAGNNN